MKLRIVERLGACKVQERVLFFFWVDRTGELSLNDAEKFVKNAFDEIQPWTVASVFPKPLEKESPHEPKIS